MKNLSINDFTRKTASGEPTPGGGSISALAGALSAALIAMVGGLSVGKEKYAEHEAEMKSASERMTALSERLLDEIEKDSRSFDLYMQALALPKDTEEEKAARRSAMQEGLKAAVEVPLGVCISVMEVFPLAELMLRHGNPTAVTDALVGTMMARTAVLGAAANVKINLRSIRDEAYVSDTYRKVCELEKEALYREERLRAMASTALDP